MDSQSWEFESTLWEFATTKASWYFVTLPVDVGQQIGFFAEMKAAWGSIPVHVKVGSSTWQTSLFPDKKTDSYVLPIKASVRQKEHIHKGDAVAVSVALRS